ncbi:hypothetical protein SV1_6 [Streptomyces phage SV1]|uniref:hypothetical protein n=1 Tax=Streptomyces phage SV1 TaxID=1204525 RepID=UPI00028B0DCD|nr:hypothetical protein D280_gp06 [Streptomyces phage SV1]AFU62146.1 hypothetical protein SV1_6 [Streptomyces phage SV1]
MTTAYRHPLAQHAAGTVLGYRRDGRPIHVIAGGNGAGEGSGAPAGGEGTGQAPAAPQQPAAQPGTAPQQPAAAPGGEPQDVASLPQWAQNLIRDTRAEAATYRTRAQAAGTGEPQQPQQPQAPAAPAPAPAATDGDVSRLPQWAQRALTESQTAARTAAIQTAILRAAPGAGADPARLLDSASFTASLATVDPNDTAAVAAAITAALTAQPWLSAQPGGPVRGGADFGQQPNAPRRPTSLTDAISAAYSG